MVGQTQNAHSEQPPKQLSRIFLVGIIALMSLSALIWILNSEGIVQGTWSTIFPVVFTVFGIILALLQWYTQASPRSAAPSLLPPVPRNQTTNHKPDRGVDLGLNDGKGALIVYTNRCLRGTTINPASGFNMDSLRHQLAANVVQRNGQRHHLFVGVFPSLEPGNYTVHFKARQRVAKVIVPPGYAVEIDWR
jgi:hypothetical protein